MAKERGKYAVQYPVVQAPGGVKFGNKKGRVDYGAYIHNQLARFRPTRNAEGFGLGGLTGGFKAPTPRPDRRENITDGGRGARGALG